MHRLQVAEAVNFLIQAPNYGSLINELTQIIERWDTRPMVYEGRLKCLNAMIETGLQSRAAFEALLKLIEEKRKQLPQAKRVDYQRELMRERRARTAKALELHELHNGRLRGSLRTQFIGDLQKRWQAERARFISAKGELTWAERNAAANEFWEMVDRNLDANIIDARRKRA